MNEPARIKNGMAINVKCSDVSNIFSTNDARESLANKRMVVMD